MFLPLSLSIGFAMIVSYTAAQTLVPVISNWMLKAEKFQYQHTTIDHAHAGLALDEKEVDEVVMHTEEDTKHASENNFFQRLKMRLVNSLQRWMPNRKPIV
ncbi:hypothetical protein, partial [Parafilimonas sp.]|uniref:hypothetical protein n=1 Tax=Parafilimonas sp. TaxID=1969739 RepID=UPI003F7EE3CE